MKPVFSPGASASVLVVGDVILDRYVHGETSRISPEAPVPVVLVRQTEERPGGAGNVAMNISSLGLRVHLVGMTGRDPAADILERELGQQSVSCHFLQKNEFSTITKLRVICQHQQLIRLDYETGTGVSENTELFSLFRKVLGEVDIVVLSDYAKGSLAQVQEYIAACRSVNKKVLIDPKGRDFECYRGASLLTPNMKEFESVVGQCANQEELTSRGQNLCRKLELEMLLVTQGENGMTVIPAAAETVHLDAEAREVFDVTGAGDTVIATMASALASGYDFVESAIFANRAAGLVVAKLGAASVTVEEINRVSESVHEHFRTELQLSELDAFLETIRRRDETIVMTNGCFDILHAGHVAYLNEARKLGDHLLVAVNDDDSVRRLKGEGRPVNPLANRLAVLSALKPVDWVIAFSEDTPEALVEKISPDVLVKGGDYRPDEIAGADHVIKNGGTVKIIPLLEGCSTSGIINTRKKEQV